MYKINKKFLMLFIIIFILLYFIWQFPIKKYLAIKDFNKYLISQGIDKNNIIYKKIYKSYLLNEYDIHIIFKDDAEFNYHYVWCLNAIQPKNCFHIHLVVTDQCNKLVKFTGKIPKYSSLTPY